jgi:hypothetical protein
MACIVSLTALDAAPNDCALTAPLSMTVRWAGRRSRERRTVTKAHAGTLTQR